MKIIFPANLRRSFRRAAKKAFPNETCAICFGRSLQTKTEIQYLYYPPIILDSDGMGFSLTAGVEEYAKTLALELKLNIVGSIHSHPYPDESTDPKCCVPSEIDWDNNNPNEIIGICQLYPLNGSLRTRFKFWPPITHIPYV